VKLLAPRVIASLINTSREHHDPAVADVARVLADKLHRAEKFVFDSGMAGNEAEEDAFKETAVNMMEAGIFHLPFPEIWIEDPFPTPAGRYESRYMYFCEEGEDEIRVWYFADPEGNIFSLPHPLVIDLLNPKDTFGYPSGNPQNAACWKVAAEAIFAVKKFIVTLSTRGTERERVKGGNHALNMKPRGRKYPHTVVRIPTDYSAPVEGQGISGQYRRMHIVRGYTWGKNTRPLAEQRWIQPFFRGREELGEVIRDHYVVKA
jgi:hypothetical protein